MSGVRDTVDPMRDTATSGPVAPSEDVVLSVKDLRTYIRLRRGEVKAVDGVSFDVRRGETLGVVGESGCGKTMTGMSIMRLLPNGGYIAGGSIQLGDVDLVTARPDVVRSVRANRIGMVFQDPMTSLNPTMTIGRQIGESVRLHKGASKKVAAERAAEVLDLVGMPKPRERLDDFPHQLSGGLRQRVMIAMALACEPEVLIADEPTTALDVTIQAQILTLLDRLRAELGMAMILITHDMGVIAGRADRVMVMYAGKVIETATTGELFSNMHHPYTEALMASIPQLGQDTTQRLYSIPGLPPDLSKEQHACRFSPRCLFATDQCRTEEPLLGGGDPAHPFACFHPRSSTADDLTGADGLVTVALTSASNRKVAEESAALVAGSVVLEGMNDAHSASRDDLLVLHEVSKEFGVTSGAVLRRSSGSVKAVTEVNLSVRRGETLGLVGESGCGKTTLGRMAVALEAPTAGSISFDGTDLTSLRGGALRHFRRNLQMMFQDPYASLDPRMRVGDIIREPLSVQHEGRGKEQVSKVRELLAEVGLPSNAVDRYPHEFSGGQRQRVGLARALALRPQLIVADEPVSALDVSIRSQILNLMKSLQASHDLTYVFISHDLSVVRYLADRIGVMYLGRLVELGSGDDIYHRAAHPYTAGLLATVPVPNPEVEKAKKGAAIQGEIPSSRNPPSGCRFRTRCPKAQDICAEEVPAMRSFGGEHVAACHFPLQQPVTLSTKPASTVTSA
jgi:peptide/nickel transport system ATP-binding protein